MLGCEYENSWLYKEVAGLPAECAALQAQLQAEQQAEMLAARQVEDVAAEQLEQQEQPATSNDARPNTTTPQPERAHKQPVPDPAVLAGTPRGQKRAQLVVRAPQGSTCTQVSTAMAECLRCEQSGVQVRLVTKPTPPFPTRDPRMQQPEVPGAASASTATTTPSRRLVFVVDLPTMQLVDGALKGRQCRELLQDGGYDFKLDDYLTREEMQQRMRMRPTQRRLQQNAVIAAWRGVELWQLAAPEGAAPGVDKTWSRVETATP